MGMMRNLQEVFFSKIPSSMNKFRSFVLEDENMVMEPTTPNLVRSMNTSKEKIDIEMGHMFGEESGLSLPDILRSLDFDEIDDNLKNKEEDGTIIDSEPCFFTAKLGEEMQSSAVEERTNEELKSEEVNSSHRHTPPPV